MFLKIELKLFPGLLAYHSKREHHGTYYILIGIEAFIPLLAIDPWRTEVFVLMIISILVLSLEEEKCLYVNHILILGTPLPLKFCYLVYQNRVG